MPEWFNSHDITDAMKAWVEKSVFSEERKKMLLQEIEDYCNIDGIYD